MPLLSVIISGIYTFYASSKLREDEPARAWLVLFLVAINVFVTLTGMQIAFSGEDEPEYLFLLSLVVLFISTVMYITTQYENRTGKFSLF
jgi:Na+/melibiose symporter-like transporter